MNARLIIAIITSLIDEVIILVVILVVLPIYDIRLSWWAIALIVIAFLIYAVATFIIGTRILKKKPLPGLTDMTGTEGKVTSDINPKGFVRIEGELWEAKAENGPIEKGASVVVVSQNGLKLTVKRKP